MLRLNHLFTFSGIGPRTQMQDAGLFRSIPHQSKSFGIVCDGIGGQPGGAEAADICVSVYDNFLLNSTARNMVNKTSDFIRLGMLQVVDAFYNHIQTNPDHLYMGCTLAMVYCEEDYVHLCWCGDSRIYLFRNGRIYFKSLPHNPIFDDYRAGKIPLQEAEKKRTNIITRAILASEAFPILEIKKIKVIPGDRFLVCTDGVWNTLGQTHYSAIAATVDLNTTNHNLNTFLGAHANDNYWGCVLEVK